MNTLRIAAFTASTGILIAGIAFAYQQIEPHLSEQGCIIHATKEAGESGIHAARACRDRFEQSQKEEELPQFAWSELEGRAQFQHGTVSARLYNGDDLYTITRLRVGITDPTTTESEDPVTHFYDVHVDLPPMSSATEEFSVYLTYDNIHWQVVNAWGYDARE